MKENYREIVKATYRVKDGEESLTRLGSGSGLGLESGCGFSLPASEGGGCGAGKGSGAGQRKKTGYGLSAGIYCGEPLALEGQIVFIQARQFLAGFDPTKGFHGSGQDSGRGNEDGSGWSSTSD